MDEMQKGEIQKQRCRCASMAIIFVESLHKANIDAKNKVGEDEARIGTELLTLEYDLLTNSCDIAVPEMEPDIDYFNRNREDEAAMYKILRSLLSSFRNCR